MENKEISKALERRKENDWGSRLKEAEETEKNVKNSHQVSSNNSLLQRLWKP